MNKMNPKKGFAHLNTMFLRSCLSPREVLVVSSQDEIDALAERNKKLPPHERYSTYDIRTKEIAIPSVE